MPLSNMIELCTRSRYGKWSTGNPWSSSAHTLPREVTWHPELRQLVFSPLEEQTALRGAVIGHLTPQPLAAGTVLPLGLPAMLGNQSELNVSFARPSSACTMTVRFMADHADNRSGSSCSIDYLPPPADSAAVTCDGYKHQLKLSPSDTAIQVRVFVDNVFSEAYFQGGRVVMTLPAQPCVKCAMYVSASGSDVASVSATVHRVNSIWVAPADVLRAERPDKGDSPLMAARIDREQRGGDTA